MGMQAFQCLYQSAPRHVLRQGGGQPLAASVCWASVLGVTNRVAGRAAAFRNGYCVDEGRSLLR